MDEIWRDIQGYEGLYQISNKGRVKSLKCGKEKILRPRDNVNGYLFVNLGRKNKKYIHRLVYETFKGFKNKNSIINHINSDKRDNKLNNLEECNYSYNLIYAYYHGERKLKPVSQFSLNGVLIDTYTTGKEASEKTGVSRSGICNCCKGKRKSAGRFIWKYKEKD